MTNVLRYAILAAAAALEVFGDLGIRRWVERSAVRVGVLGGVALVLYGLVLNVFSSARATRALGMAAPMQFGPLLGFYITVFFVVSQVVGVYVLGEPMPTGVLQWAGVVMIVGGGLAFLAGAPG